MKTLKIFLVVLAVLTMGYFLLQWPHSTSRYYSETFYLQDDFDTVRKVFVRTDAVEKILAANNAEIVEKKIEGISVGADKLFNPNWVVDFNGLFKIRFNDPKWGKREIVLRQYANITPQRMVLSAYMVRPQKELQQYKFDMILSTDGTRTRVEIRMLVGLKYHAPNLKVIHDKVDAELERSLVQGVSKMREALKACVQQYRGKKFILRLPTSKVATDTHRR